MLRHSSTTRASAWPKELDMIMGIIGRVTYFMLGAAFAAAVIFNFVV